MLAVVENKKRAPYRTKRWWAQFDVEMTRKFPIGAMARCHRGRAYVQVKILSHCSRGKITVYNMISGKEYKANVECMIPPAALSPDAMKQTVAAEHARRAEEQARDRSRPSIVRQFLQPLTDADKRSPDYVERARILPLSPDELIAYSALSAINRTLNTLHMNRDSFRNPRLFDLLRASHTCLAECVREMESYEKLPEEA